MKRMLFNLIGGKEEFRKVFNKHRVEHFEFSDGKFFEENRKTGEKEEVHVEIAAMTFDSSFSAYLKEIFEIAVRMASKLSPEPINGDLAAPLALIDLVIMKMQYEPPKDTFEFGAELFASVAMGHRLQNGNKRVAFMFMNLTLLVIGFSVLFRAEFQSEYKKYVKQLTEFVERMQSDITKGEEQERIMVKKEIANWIENLTFIEPYDMPWVKW